MARKARLVRKPLRLNTGQPSPDRPECVSAVAYSAALKNGYICHARSPSFLAEIYVRTIRY
jgi:hypothetical protein